MEILSSTKTLSFDDAVTLYKTGDPRNTAIALFFYNGEDLKNGFVKNFPKDWEDFCTNYKNKHNEGECYISTGSEIRESTAEDKVNPKSDKNLVPNKQCAEAVLALTQLLQLREFYRQGWKPNLTASTGIFAIFYMKNKYTVEEFIYSSEFLTFQTREIANEFLFNFRDLIEKAGDLI